MIARWSAASWSKVAISRQVNVMTVPKEPSYAIPMEETLDGILGFEVLELNAEHASARFEVQNQHRQAFGIVHGGVYAALAEGLASGATYRQVMGDGKIAVGSSNYTSFL